MYTTRVGEGPLPTELKDHIGDYLQQQGHEFGTTTSRPRRCGWFDLVVVRHSSMLSGVTHLAITKLDVLTGLKTIKICTHYKINGETIDYFPANTDDLQNCEPKYKEFPGWMEIPAQMTKYVDLPENAQNYLDFIQNELSIPIKIVSYGPRRTETIEC